MRAEIISIGDELLIGQTINTNAAWMGEQLNLNGIDVIRASAISDKAEDIKSALDESLNRVQLVLLTGGLGPTKDDITKLTLAEYFNTRLVRNPEVLTLIENYFTKRGREMLETNRAQADLPENCTVLLNDEGTAAGMWFERDNKIVISMPGVPYEMKHLMLERVFPLLRKKFSLPLIVHRTILTQGIGESFLAEKIKDWETQLRAEQFNLAYLPSPGIVKLRITAKGNHKEELESRIQNYINELMPMIPDFFFGYEKDTLEKVVGELLLKKKATLSTAESCTGGYIAHRITSVSGSSDYFSGSVISYSNEVKIQELGVSSSDLKTFGAVSQQVVEQMAKGVLKKMKTDYSIAVSGIAGPNGGSDEKPVGTVWIAVADQNRVFSKQFLFENHRERNITRASLTALMMLRKFILKAGNQA